ncbi:PREDICTED: squamous cell carcinoma antigen recognized by T-cells 3 [Polistes dominula]|uniref:Squamous cell carcinoma antigen recognized by T-cells 3 n=1 Tax=Polistes dominula TaxID=743375 RepID=A0ABM1J0B0_POLDO|nr:PREDICTED: squamous cell carcinoma antigen recognized by T-cells 3 [Polistes dominula]
MKKTEEMDYKNESDEESCSGTNSLIVSKKELKLRENEEDQEVDNKDVKKDEECLNSDSDDDAADDDDGKENNDDHMNVNEDNDNDNDNDDDDDVGDDDDDANEAEIKALEALLAENPYDYSSHIKLIKKFQMMGELERLRNARENMSSMYPLSSELWLSWLRDEMKLAVSSEEKAEVVKLCERAVKDYLCVQVWMEYLQFSIGNMDNEKDGVKNVRALFESALTSAGLHIIKGAVIWEAYREFEAVLLALIDPTNESEKKQQLSTIGNLFRRQLACPLLDMEKTYEEYETWRAGDGAEATLLDNLVLIGYERALEMLNNRLPYEEKIVSSRKENELLDAYKEYLSYEKIHGDPGRVTVLYERAVADLSLEVSLWVDYINYLENNIKIESVLNKAYEKASRNVPWCSTIWQKWIRAYEKWERPVLDINNLFEKSLIMGFSEAKDYRDLWMKYLEYLCRRLNDNINTKCTEIEKQKTHLRNTFNKACEHLAKMFGLDGDPNGIILQYWARMEAIHENMERARSLWTDILSLGHSATASYWLEYISLERFYGDSKHLRKIYKRALNSVKDCPEIVANCWLNFERDGGTLEQVEYCEMRIQEKMAKLEEEKSSKAKQASVKKESFGQARKGIRRKADDISKWKNLGVSSSKIIKVEEKNEFKLRESRLNLDKSYCGEEVNQSTEDQPPPGFKASENEKTDTNREVDDKLTVFISNLDYTAIEDEVRDALQPVGPITLVKMVKDYKGRNKGYCYVQLSNTEAVEKALTLDRTPIKGRPMFISRCDPNKSTRASGFKYNSTLEKNKLFVKGLPITTTTEDLDKIFNIHGKLKDVRLVTYRNGHSKGLAYVEYFNETDAAKALLATDGMNIDNKEISVAISQPPERKKEEVFHGKSLGSSTVSRTTFGVPKTLLSMVPRNVMISSNNTNKNLSKIEVSQPKSNQDFRNMLLSKK